MLLILAATYGSGAFSSGMIGAYDWLAAPGIAACLLVISPRREVPWLVLGTAVAAAVGGSLVDDDVAIGVSRGVAYGLEAYVIARLMTRNWFRAPRLRSWNDLRRYLVAVTAGSAVPAVLAFVGAAALGDGRYADAATWVFFNHAACNLVLLQLVTERLRAPRISWVEAAAHAALVGVALTLNYGPGSGTSGVFLLTAVVVWAASRFPKRLGILELAVLAIFMSWQASRGVGPFSSLDLQSSPVLVMTGMQSFLVVSVVIALAVATSLGLERQRALSTHRAKDALINTLSHELRTPLTSIVGSVELLTGDMDMAADERSDLQSRVSRNAERLLSMADNMLTLAAMDQREWTPDRRLTDLRECVLAAREAVAVPAERVSDLRVHFDVPDEPVPVVADCRAIERVVFNLLSNAIKYTPGPGSVHVRLTTSEFAARISVADDGMGIAREDQRHLFERFYRTSTAKQHVVPGTGLGLSIVRSIVAAHGGEIRVDSVVGVGSTFSVDLPLHPVTVSR
ncbi:ATP-binding protein [Nocardioides piscis]|uniref:histidine kinase n=1 Tax=Nocardioides piscis TaxID=2714938 RepID=A0A6G7YI48_9ACTN|nr:ATP-binding protein [Nocardioides piscis]QIK76409.1 hypothetical protein G7071_14225 [Nocardioides piscis]